MLLQKVLTERCRMKWEALNLLCIYLQEHYQKDILKGQTTYWELLKSGVPQGSVLGPLRFLYALTIHQTVFNLLLTFFLMANNFFSHVFNKSGCELYNDLQVMNNWAFRWKIQLNSNINNHSQDFKIARFSFRENLGIRTHLCNIQQKKVCSFFFWKAFRNFPQRKIKLQWINPKQNY